MPPRVKASGAYLNGRFAVADAKTKGFEIPILLNSHGNVSEGPGQNVFLVRDGTLITPAVTHSILEGITRETIIELAGELGIEVEQREVDHTELYIADELFFSGSLIEVQPIVEIDSYVVGDGKIGSITEQLQDAYLATVTGARDTRHGWLTSVYQRR
jgi:branched-chain amino acid aminotransferase